MNLNEVKALLIGTIKTTFPNKKILNKFTENENGNHILLHYNYSTFKTEYQACEVIGKYIDDCSQKFMEKVIQ